MSERRSSESVAQKALAACTCDPEAYDVGPEGQRRYFEDRYCPIHGERVVGVGWDGKTPIIDAVTGKPIRVPAAPSLPGGNYTCSICGAVVAWEGELPDDCLRCGASPVERILSVVRQRDEVLYDECIDALGWHESAKLGVDPDA